MKEDFDNRLSDHIKAVFEDAGNNDADAGWALLREKYPPVDNRKPFVWFWWLAAAMIISATGFGLWQVEKKMGKDKTIKTVAKARNDSARQHVSPQRVNGKGQSADKMTTSGISNAPAANTKKEQRNPISQISHYGTTQVASSHLKTSKLFKKDQHKTSIINKGSVTAINPVPNTNGATSPANALPDSHTVDTVNTTLLTDGISGFMIDRSSLEPRALVTDQLRSKQNPDASAQKAGLNKVKLLVPGIFGSAFYNSAKGSDNEFNLAGGGSLDVNLTRHFGLSTGLGIVRNTFSYIGYHTPPGVYASSPWTTVVSTSLPPDELTAKITAIDIPLNLKYSFGSYNYISAGLSSFIYINEYYDNISNSITASSFAVQQHTIINKNFDGMGLFKTLNLSIAHCWPINKKSVLLFEPFYKIGIGNQGLQSIKYNSAGITLKLNFQSVAQ